MTSSSICACFCWCIYLQYAMRFIGIIMSKPITIWPGQLSFVLWYVECTTKSSDARIIIYRSASSTYVFCGLYVRTRIPITWCIISMILFACGFNWESCLVLIRYSLFYQAIFKLVNKKLSFLVICDLYWPRILDQPFFFKPSFRFLSFSCCGICHFKLPGEGVYFCKCF